MPYSAPEHLKTEAPFTNELEFYTTSNMRDFTGLNGPPADTARPGTSQFYSNTEIIPTGYNEQFGWKSVDREEPTRTGTSSGQRANNPHPKESFMVWKFPNTGASREELSQMKKNLMTEICKDKLNSTYQGDYKGLQQGQREQQDLEKYKSFLSGQQHVPERTLNTTVRADFRQPKQNIHLAGNVSRYGANAKKMHTALGAVPTVVDGSPLLDLNLRTSYAEGFQDKSGSCILKPSAIPTLNKYMSTAQEGDKHILQNMLSSLEGMKLQERFQAPAEEVSQGTVQLERLSEFDGPSWK